MRILSGTQSSGKLHLGNYFGMMEPMLRATERGEVFLFIADYHALTTVRDPDLLRTLNQDVALDFLACGLDPEKVVFYQQSDVPEVTELTWMLSTITPMGLLERCHSYKDKIAKGLAASNGLFSYPVLMSADILSMQANLVPVGKDQKQHIEVARDLAIKFNHMYGEVFAVPEPEIKGSVAVVPGLDGQKMSKSYNNTIEIFGPAKAVRKKFMKIVTDSKGVEDPKDPDESLIFSLYKLFATEDEQAALAERFRAGGMGYGEAKQELYTRFEDVFGPCRERREELAADLPYVRDVLQDGAKKAKAVASETLDKARHAMGLGLPV